MCLFVCLLLLKDTICSKQKKKNTQMVIHQALEVIAENANNRENRIKQYYLN